jgi:hypothetical protein
MPKTNWLVTIKRRSYSALPRAHICTRAVHHIFRSKRELRDAESDELPGPSRLIRILQLGTITGGRNVVY